jgi:hypothetical protein
VSLKASDWNLEGAFEFFFNQPPARPATDPRFLEELYLRYKDPYSDMILVDGVSAFCDDLQVDPGDVVMVSTLVICKSFSTNCLLPFTLFIGARFRLEVYLGQQFNILQL